MTQMLGKLAANAVLCNCCNADRTHGQQRMRETKSWQRDILREAAMDEAEATNQIDESKNV